MAVFPAYIAAAVAVVVCGIPAARQQHAFQPILKDELAHAPVDWARLGIVVFILVTAIVANILANTQMGDLAEFFPVLGLAVWVAILVGAAIRKPDWSLIPGAFKGAVFLLSLVWAASMMPVDQLPIASWKSAFGLGFVSAVFDNIPLTSLALHQGGYDWGVLAFAVGFGGSMIWFGSSAGVALSSQFPQARSVGAWIKGGWHVAVAYVVGFAVMMALWGWHPTPKRALPTDKPAALEVAPASASSSTFQVLKVNA